MLVVNPSIPKNFFGERYKKYKFAKYVWKSSGTSRNPSTQAKFLKFLMLIKTLYPTLSKTENKSVKFGFLIPMSLGVVLWYGEKNDKYGSFALYVDIIDLTRFAHLTWR